MRVPSGIKIRAHVLVLYGVSFVVALFGPELTKRLVTGSSGPNTHFTATVIICPLVFALLGIAGGRRLAAIHGVLLFLLVLWSSASYPENPSMNFLRQIAHELPLGLFIMYLVGGAIATPVGVWPSWWRI